MMQVSQSSHIIYEQPLSERIRTFLRLEFLFHRARYLLEHESPWASRLTFEVLIDVMAVFSRADLKKEIIKELERHAATLEALSRNPNVAQERLEEIRGKGAGDASGVARARVGPRARAASQRTAERGAATQQHPGRHVRLRPARVPLLARAPRQRTSSRTARLGGGLRHVRVVNRPVPPTRTRQCRTHARDRERRFLSAKPRLVDSLPDDPRRSGSRASSCIPRSARASSGSLYGFSVPATPRRGRPRPPRMSSSICSAASSDLHAQLAPIAHERTAEPPPFPGPRFASRRGMGLSHQ